uniref:Integrase catalytic domain-containing protein n=1 Tax=Strongyloides stercoralis TaxID=6248 RepID=A0A0K0DRZ3_STRER
MEELDSEYNFNQIVSITKRNPNNLYTTDLNKDLESFIEKFSNTEDFNFSNNLENNILELTFYGNKVFVYNPLGPNKSESSILHFCVRINEMRSSKLECIRTYGLMKAKYAKKYGYRNLTSKCIYEINNTYINVNNKILQLKVTRDNLYLQIIYGLPRIFRNAGDKHACHICMVAPKNFNRYLIVDKVEFFERRDLTIGPLMYPVNIIGNYFHDIFKGVMGYTLYLSVNYVLNKKFITAEELSNEINHYVKNIKKIQSLGKVLNKQFFKYKHCSMDRLSKKAKYPLSGNQTLSVFTTFQQWLHDLNRSVQKNTYQYNNCRYEFKNGFVKKMLNISMNYRYPTYKALKKLRQRENISNVVECVSHNVEIVDDEKKPDYITNFNFKEYANTLDNSYHYRSDTSEFSDKESDLEYESDDDEL